MQASQFDKCIGRVSAFNLYTSNAYENFVLVIATCPTASPLVHWAAKVLTDATLDFMTNPVKVNISVYDTLSKDNNKFTCVHAIIQADSRLLMSYFKDLNLTPPNDVKSRLDPSTITVGPCLYRTPGGAKYIKVRMSGYSVPFVMDASIMNWCKTETKQAILKNNRIGGYLLDQIFIALESRSEFIMDRARQKPLNLSMIDEYGKYRMWFYREPEEGVYEPAVKTDLAHPDYKPVIVFEIGKLKHFIMIEDKFYKISAFTSRRDFDDHGQPAKVVTPPVEARDGYLLIADCKPLDPDDTFTVEKIDRCIKHNL